MLFGIYALSIKRPHCTRNITRAISYRYAHIDKILNVKFYAYNSLITVVVRGQASLFVKGLFLHSIGKLSRKQTRNKSK